MEVCKSERKYRDSTKSFASVVKNRFSIDLYVCVETLKTIILQTISKLTNSLSDLHKSENFRSMRLSFR